MIQFSSLVVNREHYNRVSSASGFNKSDYWASDWHWQEQEVSQGDLDQLQQQQRSENAFFTAVRTWLLNWNISCEDFSSMTINKFKEKFIKITSLIDRDWEKNLLNDYNPVKGEYIPVELYDLPESTN
ncbi:MAG: hypothetical protein U0003_00500 [Vampirovibrionales bacterium]